MTESNNQPNPIEESIGERAQTPEKSSPSKMSEQNKQDLRNLPIPQDLEELNRQTEERLSELGTEKPITDEEHLQEQTKLLETAKKTTPASKPDPQPVTETSTLESPPQKVNDSWACAFCKEIIPIGAGPDHNCDRMKQLDAEAIAEIATGSGETILDLHKKHVATYNKSAEKLGIPEIEEEIHHVAKPIPGIEKLSSNYKIEHNYKVGLAGATPAEEKDLTALKAYILDNGFVVAIVAMHIRMLCTSAMTTPSTTDWDFADRSKVPDLVFALLHQPGYLDSIWPSLAIIMGSNKANPAWTAGISMTIAFFDLIKTLPVLKELKDIDES